MRNQVQVAGFVPRPSTDVPAFIDADYREGQPGTFKGYIARVGFNGDRSPHFDTIDEAGDYARENGADQVFVMSSCDHYEADSKRATS